MFVIQLLMFVLLDVNIYSDIPQLNVSFTPHAALHPRIELIINLTLTRRQVFAAQNQVFKYYFSFQLFALLFKVLNMNKVIKDAA